MPKETVKENGRFSEEADTPPAMRGRRRRLIVVMFCLLRIKHGIRNREYLTADSP